MDYAKKTQNLEAKREKLEAQLEIKGISEQERHDIRQQISDYTTEITALYTLQGQMALQPAVARCPEDVYIKVTLVGWRRYVGLRERVTNCARIEGARGYVSPRDFDILLELRFKAPEACAKFEIELRSATRLFNVQIPKFDMQTPPSRAAAFPFVEAYQRLDELSPDREISATTPERRSEMRNQVFTFQRIEDVPFFADMCHLIPRRIVSSKADQWCFLFASSIFKSCTDATIPTVSFRVGGPATHVTVVENRTALLLTVDFSACEDDARVYFRRTVVNSAQWNGWEATIPIHVVAGQEDLFREAIQWRTDSVALFREAMRQDPTNPQHRWYTMIPLDAQDEATGTLVYKHLALYKVPVKSERQSAEHEESPAEDDLESVGSLLQDVA
jgi:hypothetical protein